MESWVAPEAHLFGSPRLKGALSAMPVGRKARGGAQAAAVPAGQPHVSCSDLWGELTEEQALQLAMRLSREEDHAAPLDDDEGFRHDMDEAMRLSTAAGAPEAEDEELHAALELSRRAAEGGQGHGPSLSPPPLLFGNNWWMTPGESTDEAEPSTSRGALPAPPAPSLNSESLSHRLSSNFAGSSSHNRLPWQETPGGTATGPWQLRADTSSLQVRTRLNSWPTNCLVLQQPSGDHRASVVSPLVIPCCLVHWPGWCG